MLFLYISRFFKDYFINIAIPSMVYIYIYMITNVIYIDVQNIY